MNAYFLSIEENPTDNYLDKPFIFIKDSSNRSDLNIQSFSPNKITLTANTDTSTKMVFKQNFYSYWFYNNGINKMAVYQEGVNFMSAPLVKGANKITFSFEPRNVINAMILSASLFIIYCIALGILYFKK